MSTTLIDGGPAGPDEAGGQYRNRILTDRKTWWQALGGRQGVLRGLEHSTVAGQMQLSFAAGEAVLEERDSLDVANTDRGYLAWTDAAAIAQFDVASASSRNDAVVIAFVDVSVGAAALGTGTTTVGGQLVVVPGVSGSTTPRTDAEIADYVGSGGWARVLDVIIDPTDTEINPVNITVNPAAFPYAWRPATMLNGFAAGTPAPEYLIDAAGRVELRGRIEIGTASSGLVAFILDEDYRPSEVLQMLTVTSPPSTSAGRVIVNPDGTVQPFTNSGSPTAWLIEGNSFNVAE